MTYIAHQCAYQLMHRKEMYAHMNTKIIMGLSVLLTCTASLYAMEPHKRPIFVGRHKIDQTQGLQRSASDTRLYTHPKKPPYRSTPLAIKRPPVISCCYVAGSVAIVAICGWLLCHVARQVGQVPDAL